MEFLGSNDGTNNRQAAIAKYALGGTYSNIRIEYKVPVNGLTSNNNNGVMFAIVGVWDTGNYGTAGLNIVVKNVTIISTGTNTTNFAAFGYYQAGSTGGVSCENVTLVGADIYYHNSEFITEKEGVTYYATYAEYQEKQNS